MKEKDFKQIIPGPDDMSRRIDRILRIYLENLPLSKIYSSLRKGDIRVNSQKVKEGYRLSEGDVLYIKQSLLGDGLARQSREERKTPRQLPLSTQIIYKNEHIICINKPWGVPVHGKNSLLQMIKPEEDASDSLSFRTGPLHRLDRNTSGIVCFSRSTKGARHFTTLMNAGLIEKTYIGVLEGTVKNSLVLEDKLIRDKRKKITIASSEGKEALTTIYPKMWEKGLTLAEIVIKSGRTHQIRAHAGLNGFPLAGDVKYRGTPLEGGRYILHAWKIKIPAGDTVFGFKTLTAPLPEESDSILKTLFPDCGY